MKVGLHASLIVPVCVIVLPVFVAPHTVIYLMRANVIVKRDWSSDVCYSDLSA